MPTTATNRPNDQASARPVDARFSETHRRRLRAPFPTVTAAMVDVTAVEVRAFGPLIALRGLPSRLAGRTAVAAATTDGSLLELFEREGFLPLRSVDEPGRRVVEYGAIGRFWSARDNHPVALDTLDDYRDFDEPGMAKIWFDLTARTLNDGEIELSTTTLITGTDRAAELRFAPYWALIRLPSGLIRRSWLAAIERRAHA